MSRQIYQVVCLQVLAPGSIFGLILLDIFTKIGENEPTTVEHESKNNEAIITFSQPGKIFGEMSVFEVSRTASVVCATAGVCLCIDMSILDQMDNSRVCDSIRAGMYKVIQSRFKMAKDKIDAEKKRLEMKYANILRIEKRIQKNRNF